jgi:hypothetical protein
MGYLSQHYLDSMANLYHNNFYNNAVCERDVVSRSSYQHQAIRGSFKSRILGVLTSGATEDMLDVGDVGTHANGFP